MKRVDSALQFIHKAMLIRRLILAWSVWFTTYVAFETFDVVMAIADKNPEGVWQAGTLIAAVYTPLFAFQGAILKFYAQYKYQDGE